MSDERRAAMATERLNELLTGAPRDSAAGTPILFMNEHDLTDVHEKIANCMRAIGFTGPALDEAIAGSFKVAIDLIERDRAVDHKRRASLRTV